MGEVYKAADTRLNRTVAIKVLPAQFSENLEMKQRFEREAQTIAGLNHPHICTLYDAGHQDGIEYLVMEYLEGESLAERLARGALPLDEAVKVAIAIADALDKAHGQGVTHRDLKPGNIMLTEGGAKLLDFGLAKLRQQTSRPGSGSAPAGDTTPGTILGTMQYMSPEQLEGKDADARTDIFAFGAVLYEMVTGKKVFDARSQALLIASIMSAEPEPLSKTEPTAPSALDYVVKQCLAKDPEQRWQTAGDMLRQLRWIAEGDTESGVLSTKTVWWRKPGLAARAALAVVALLVAVMALPTVRYYRGADKPPETRFVVTVPDMPVPEAVSISPDGRWIAFSARDASSTALFVRPLITAEPTKLVGTEGAGRLFWSPDSRSIAFFAGGKLKKVDAVGGAPQNICETPDLLGGTWNSEGVIVFASSQGLQRVLAIGGEPSPIQAAGAAGTATEKRQEPYFLPDGRHYLYLAASEKPSGAAIFAGALDSKDATRLVSAQSNAVYAAGHLFYHREGTLYAQAFNPGKLSLSGEAVRIADKIPYGTTGAAAFAASQTGILIFRNNSQLQTPGGPAANAGMPSVPLLWVDRSGKKLEQAAMPDAWAGLDLSPDGKRVAVHRHDANGGDIWIFEAGTETPSKFTFDATQDNSMPTWSPDGTQIAFGSRRNGKRGIYLKLSNNTRNEELLIETETPAMPMSWSPDGKLLVYWTNESKTSGDIWAVPLTGEKKPIAILQTPADERNPQVSPDGKWIAYSSNETGRSEIYIKSFPDGPAKIQVSVNGGVFPRWRHDGKELYFMSLVSLGNFMASEIRVTGSSIQRDVPRVLFQSVFVNGGHSAGQYQAYAASANGQRFVIPQFESPQALFAAGAVARGRGATLNIVFGGIAADRRASGTPAISSAAPITVVLNWNAALNLK